MKKTEMLKKNYEFKNVLTKGKFYRGKEIEIYADSICVHGDGVKALEFFKKIRERLIYPFARCKASFCTSYSKCPLDRFLNTSICYPSFHCHPNFSSDT